MKEYKDNWDFKKVLENRYKDAFDCGVQIGVDIGIDIGMYLAKNNTTILPENIVNEIINKNKRDIEVGNIEFKFNNADKKEVEHNDDSIAILKAMQESADAVCNSPQYDFSCVTSLFGEEGAKDE